MVFKLKLYLCEPNKYVWPRQMKVLLVNTYENKGGAAVATKRLMHALNNNGIKAKMLVAEKKTDCIEVVDMGRHWQSMMNFLLERIDIWLHLGLRKQHLWELDSAKWGMDITRLPEFKEADVIHLSWINHGMLSLKGIRKILESGKPVVWTMHDMWPFTALCHYSYDCERLDTGCGRCRFLPGKKHDNDFSHSTFRRKSKVMGAKWPNLHFVTVSNWLRSQAIHSSLASSYPISVIGNSISLSQFPLADRDECRRQLHLPQKQIVLFGAARIDTPIKGFHFLKEALQIIADKKLCDTNQLHLVVYGGMKDPSTLEGIPCGHTYMGRIDSEKLPRVFSAANVLVSSSYYETFGQTLIEAQACGCTPVAFGNSGQADIIEHRQNGYLAQYKDANDLAEGIVWALNANLDRHALRASTARKFDDKVIAAKYKALYSSMTGKDE